MVDTDDETNSTDGDKFHDTIDTNDVSTVILKIPPFWADSPEIWFAQIEARFASHKITGDVAKFNHVVASIESGVLHQVSEAVLRPPAQDKYGHLKSLIIKRYSDSSRRKITKVLHELSLGDKRPSHLLNEMHHLSDGKFDSEVLKTIWLAAMPDDIRKIVSASDSRTTTIEQLAATADSILDAGRSHAVSAVSNGDPLCKAIEALTRRIEAMETRGRGRESSRSNGVRIDKSRNRSSSTKSAKNASTCWFHRNYGTQARRCRSPCNFGKKSPAPGEH